MKKISVIVPIYNVEKYLEKCLLSLEKQDFDSYEVIMVNDGSTDNSKSIAEMFVERNPNKFILLSQENKGQSAARNNAIKYSSAAYICYVDSDDTVEADFLKKLYQTAIKTDADLVFCAFRSLSEKGVCLKTITEERFVAGEKYNFSERKDLMLTQNAVWNKLFKREIIIRHNLFFPDRVWAEDMRFVKKYLLYTKTCVYCDAVLYNYYQRSGSTMNAMKADRSFEIFDAIEDIENYYDDKGVKEKYQEELEMLAIDQVYISAMVRLIRIGARKELKKMHKEFIKRYPCHYRNLYIKRLEKNRLIIYKLMNFRMYALIKMIFMIKK